MKDSSWGVSEFKYENHLFFFNIKKFENVFLNSLKSFSDDNQVSFDLSHPEIKNRSIHKEFLIEKKSFKKSIFFSRFYSLDSVFFNLCMEKY